MILSSLLVAVICSCVSTLPYSSAQTIDDHHKLLLISFDGFRWDYPERSANLEGLKYLQENGVRAEYIQPPFPSQTSPSHTTLVTGLNVESHGVVHNVYFNRSADEFVTGDFYRTLAINEWWDNGDEPIWITASSQGLKSGGYLFPGSNATIGGKAATRSILETARTPKSEKDWRMRIDDVMIWFKDDDFDFIALYFEQPDIDGHDNGPLDSVIATQTLPLVDRTVKYLFQKIAEVGLTDNLNVIITSDHGMTPINTTVRGDEAISIMKYVNASRVFFQYSYGPLSLLEPYPEYAEEIYQGLKVGHPHLNVYYKNELPERYHYRYNDRITSIVMTSDPGYSIYRVFPGLHINAGEHGYDYLEPDMRAAFYAIGPSFKQNFSIPGFASIHVYELMCHLLGLDPAPNNGSLSVLSPALRSGSQRVAASRSVLFLSVFLAAIRTLY